MTQKPFNERDREPREGRPFDNPDAVNTDKESLFDMHEDMQTVDSIPVEELNEQVQDERNKSHSKDASVSDLERGGF